jgi:hypothetical protein
MVLEAMGAKKLLMRLQTLRREIAIGSKEKVVELISQ